MFRVYAALFCASAAALLGQSAEYVDPSTCSGCHREIAESYARTGMGKSFHVVGVALPEFRGQTFRHDASDQYFVPSIKENKPHLRRFQRAPDGSVVNLLEKTVDYVIGSGNHAQTYLHRAPTGKLLELPLTWYSEQGGYWNMSPAYDRPDHAGFSREITYRCLFCHNAYPRLVPGADQWDGAVFPATLTEGIDCQRCHGPGRAHVQAARKGTIVNPARLARDRQTEICLQCHLETTSSSLPAARLRQGRGVFSYRPGEPLENYMLHFDHAPGAGHDDKFEIVNAAYRMRKSACFQKSGTLTCITCHDPHRPSSGSEAAGRYTRACQGCHPVLARSHPAATECASCHMQRRRPSDVVHVEMTDHWIRARPPQPAPQPAMEDNSFNNEPYRGEVVLYYPSKLAESPDSEIELALAQVADGSNLAQGLASLERLRERLRPAALFELGQAVLYNFADGPRALPFLEAAAQGSPADWRYVYLAAQAASTISPARGLEKMRRARTIAPSEARILIGVSDIRFGQRQFGEAITPLRQAIALDPDLPESHHNLGNALMEAGDLAAAQAAFAEAVRLRPEVVTFRMSLARLLMRRHELPQARYQLEQAVRAGAPRDARREGDLTARHAILGGLLLEMGDTGAAIGAFRAAVAAFPRSASAHLNLGFALAATKDFRHAEESLTTAVSLDPARYEANLKLGEILIAQARTAEAAGHLRKAAQSPSPAIRAAARKLLAGIP